MVNQSETKGLIVDNKDFGTLAICAIRYCQGRQTYMPYLIRSIIRPRISDVSDKDLQVMINDMFFYSAESEYSYERDWYEWKMFLLNEQAKRKNNGTNKKML